jgi:hypothetical protein
MVVVKAVSAGSKYSAVDDGRALWEFDLLDN